MKALIVFGLTTFTEIMQSFGVYLLGVTFDIVDILMFGIGVLIAVFLTNKFLNGLYLLEFKPCDQIKLCTTINIRHWAVITNLKMSTLNKTFSGLIQSHFETRNVLYSER